jgi:16S rRNA (cytosine1402-N4)-methyltransferase
MTKLNNYHTPVLLDECLIGLAIKPGGIYLDCTVGGGGHFGEIAGRLNSDAIAIGIDRDGEAIQWVKETTALLKPRIILEQCRFSEFETVLKKHGISAVDGIMMDLGVSSRQIDQVERGFSYKAEEAPLDMRMNRDDSTTARYILAHNTHEQLTTILAKYGEVTNAGRMATTVIRFLKNRPIETAGDLRECLEHEYGAPIKYKVLSKVFQALRIAVNNELTELDACLQKSAPWLKKGGRLIVIAYHSLEDRMVKEFLKNHEGVCTCPPEQLICTCENVALFKRVNRKIIVPEDSEIAQNPRARSAKLRIAEKLCNGVEP